MSDKYRYGIGIVGCGSIAAVHAEAVQGMDHADLVSVYSRNRKNAEILAEKHHVKACTDWDEFIHDERLDLVHVCTPSGTHLDYGRKAAEAGKHVVIEKPLEVNLERGKELIDICKQMNVQLAVVFQSRFIPATIKLQKIIRSGELGTIFQADASVKWYRDQAYYDSAAWRGTKQLDGGGVLINQAIHTLDLLQWIAGPVESVFARTGTFSHSGIEGEDTAVAVLQYRGGALGTISASTSVIPAQNRRIEIHGSRGTALLDGDDLLLTNQENNRNAPLIANTNSAPGSSTPMGGFSVLPHRKQFETIIKAISTGAIPPVSGEEGLESVGLVQCIYESAKTSEAINLQSIMRQQLQ